MTTKSASVVCVSRTGCALRSQSHAGIAHGTANASQATARTPPARACRHRVARLAQPRLLFAMAVCVLSTRWKQLLAITVWNATQEYATMGNVVSLLSQLVRQAATAPMLKKSVLTLLALLPEIKAIHARVSRNAPMAFTARLLLIRVRFNRAPPVLTTTSNALEDKSVITMPVSLAISLIMAALQIKSAPAVPTVSQLRDVRLQASSLTRSTPPALPIPTVALLLRILMGLSAAV